MGRIKSNAELEVQRQEILSKRDQNKPCIAICSGTGCLALGCNRVISAFKEEIRRQGLGDEVDIKETGCPGFCEKGTIVVIYPEGIYYLQVKPEDVPEIISETIKGKKVIDRLLYTDPSTGEKAIYESEIVFYKNQKRLLIGNNIKIDPKNIEDYLALGGYRALAKALFEMTPEQVIEEVKESNLRGRGGGGFPAGRKWKSCRNAPGEPKYVIVNCDEGDPGAFMDRALMEGNPHSVLEGLIIGAYAVGSHEGFIYVRQEYPLAVENVNIAIKQAEEYGFLGENILGSGFDFDVVVHRGAGAFVSGESSALMNALEGKVGEPRPKYIHTSESGVWDKPSNLNNVETWANIPLIINNGAEWFKSIGTEGSKGTKILSLVGKVNNTGLVEVPMGITLRDVIFKIGGGIPGDKKFKAVQTGGPSGGIIPEQYLDLPIDFDELTKLGSIMGSGGMVVMDEGTCMVDIARFFIDFLCDESCGKCVPCREGLDQMREILNNIVAGTGEEGDIELLEEIGGIMSIFSLCALGTTADNPVLTTIRYFRDEYEAHIKEKRCPALVCNDLISYYIDPAKCTACMLCLNNCPVDAIDGGKRKIHVIGQSNCTKCGICYDVCPPKIGAVNKISGEPVPPPPREEERQIKRGKREIEGV
jgi:NADH:ubiquinone oxidoreductase subunit F (NADH-binding)/(2Fe-2S) ferredoxin/Pyruvate/2-oxoacid:ferredoxin oxidoreductase delta subunit